jgi:hypothetical protein
MNKTGKRIPIADAKNIGVKNGYTQVIITAFDKNTGTTSVCTWGQSQEDCEQAAHGGNFVKKAMGWPPEKCNDKPVRQIKREKSEAIFRQLVDVIENPKDNDVLNLARFVSIAMQAQELLPNKNTHK